MTTSCVHLYLSWSLNSTLFGRENDKAHDSAVLMVTSVRQSTSQSNSQDEHYDQAILYSKYGSVLSTKTLHNEGLQAEDTTELITHMCGPETVKSRCAVFSTEIVHESSREGLC